MPAVFPASPPVASLVNRDPVSNLTAIISSLATNSTPELDDASSLAGHLRVACVWPVWPGVENSPYRPWSAPSVKRNHLLIAFARSYYALVAACILARKTEWLRNACLAAGLLFPAIAAFHGIVLAAMHKDGPFLQAPRSICAWRPPLTCRLGAVDMDVYGAFQLCSIGILAAPVTVRWSKTYFYDPARNLIFLWTGLILAGKTYIGLLSLTVEFYRLGPIECTQDKNGTVISPTLNQSFPYQDVTCGIICTEDDGPFSTLRQGSTNEIFIIPAPQKLTFGAATLLAAACCIPAILSMVSMWNKILEINWKRRFGNKRDVDLAEEIEGTNGATIGKMMNVNDIIRSFLSVVQIPVFVGAVLAIMVIGEMNFWSESVNYQTEPVSSIGQWAPIVGTVLAALGSLYVLGMHPRIPMPKNPTPSDGSIHPQNSPQQGLNTQPGTTEHIELHTGDFGDMGSRHNIIHESPMQQHATNSPSMAATRQTTSPTNPASSPDLERNPTHDSDADVRSDAGGRRKMARMIGDLGRYMGTPAPDLFDDSEFKRGRAQDFPEIPGEATRNPDLGQIRQQYNPPRDDSEEEAAGAAPLRRSRSRAGSFTSVAAGYDAMGIPISRAASPRGEAARSNTLPVARTPRDEAGPSLAAADARVARPRRRDTLEVPSPARRHGSSWSSPQMTSENTVASMEEASQESSPPTIVISSDPEASSTRAPATSTPDPNSESPKPERVSPG
ncbi:uncharacterized protein PG998_008800 [Apiospora kogelbergensis]|uniref:uncharacterized protein n=1 Tax=Apiospora kogelbergensis TaxID=1337665 RepID=UPI003130D45E